MSTTSSAADRFTYQYQQPAQRSFGEKLWAWIWCGGREYDEDDEESPSSTKMQISHPTDFRREEINIPGMSASQERFVREKALADAKKMFETLQPLRSSPSSQFATRPVQEPERVSYEQFTQPRPSPKTSSNSPGWESLKAHGRKFSDNMKKPLHFSDQRRPSRVNGEEDSAIGLRDSVNRDGPSQRTTPVTDKTNVESWESDSAKAGMEVGRI